MADDGTKFAWDEEKGDWKQVEGDEEEELEDDEEVVRCALSRTLPVRLRSFHLASSGVV